MNKHKHTHTTHEHIHMQIYRHIHTQIHSLTLTLTLIIKIYTGTPVQNFVEDVLTLTTFLDNRKNNTAYQFSRAELLKVEEADDEEREKMKTEITQEFMLRRRKRDHLPDILASMFAKRKQY
jgi:hypothetical protein